MARQSNSINRPSGKAFIYDWRLAYFEIIAEFRIHE
jgi:hypothetical protein